jgi:hypothetical protein
MAEQLPLQAASVRQTARVFSIPARALYRALAANELQSFCPSGRRAVLIFDDVKQWQRKQLAPSRMLTQDMIDNGLTEFDTDLAYSAFLATAFISRTNLEISLRRAIVSVA